jgi:hypothetical protein
MIKIKEINSKKDLKTFVKFPFKLYQGSASWVPPIISEEVRTLDKDVNPVFKDAEARYFLAYKNNKIVGRIAAIINWLEVNGQNEKKMRFGWFDFIDDFDVQKTEEPNIGLSENNFSVDYTVFPNPTNDYIQIDFVSELISPGYK